MVKGFPGSSVGRESAYNAGDSGSITRLERSPGEGHGKPLQYSCLEKPHGQRCLVGYSKWGHKELDLTERLSTAQQVHGQMIFHKSTKTTNRENIVSSTNGAGKIGYSHAKE